MHPMAEPKTDAELVDLERARLDAMHRLDTAALDDILHDEFIFTHMNGLREGKADLLTRLQGGGTLYHPAQLDDVIVKTVGSTLVISGSSRMKVEVKDTGQTFDMHNRFSSVWVDQGKGWKTLLYHSTPLAL